MKEFINQCLSPTIYLPSICNIDGFISLSHYGINYIDQTLITDDIIDKLIKLHHDYNLCFIVSDLGTLYVSEDGILKLYDYYSINDAWHHMNDQAKQNDLLKLVFTT